MPDPDPDFDPDFDPGPGPGPGDDRRAGRFRTLYQLNYRPILAYALRRVQQPEDAADVVADVFTTAWRRIDEVPPAPDDRLWLYGTAHRVLASRYRSARRLLRLTARLQENHVTIGRPAASADPRRDQVLAALADLAPAERAALQLVTWEGLSHAQAAVVLGCSVNAVGIRVHRAKTRLRALLVPGPDSGPPRAAVQTIHELNGR